ncbi:hypothetical protein TWF225_007191 [Orbilia oligospora]|uniref:Uncharacterized protein n=1 Tax=Orbilia oligospora TaxID=2813651 RepID=A0A7C8K4X9_ORBOL|nr:hypothetical protein TWF751_009936 [Orbilia oligospora]KAF3180830.1 hypothetical protein TWF225_007191 [Orbilia oligospora]KAF3254192.1 hypothetical protein TWF128_006313 [Orbilia oligospora]KAF3271980.1 hypothetical protein TWF217_003802 [Orbilia oligospora]KAF3287213.1 hypothetical protein TWF132_008584 [Orbilia oligospora]
MLTRIPLIVRTPASRLGGWNPKLQLCGCANASKFAPDLIQARRAYEAYKDIAIDSVSSYTRSVRQSTTQKSTRLQHTSCSSRILELIQSCKNTHLVKIYVARSKYINGPEARAMDNIKSLAPAIADPGLGQSQSAIQGQVLVFEDTRTPAVNFLALK